MSAVPGDPAASPVPRRFIVEIVPTSDGRVVGTVSGDDGVVTFSGWLDLLRLLEPTGTTPRIPP